MRRGWRWSGNWEMIRGTFSVPSPRSSHSEAASGGLRCVERIEHELWLSWCFYVAGMKVLVQQVCLILTLSKTRLPHIHTENRPHGHLSLMTVFSVFFCFFSGLCHELVTFSLICYFASSEFLKKIQLASVMVSWVFLCFVAVSSRDECCYFSFRDGL